MTENDVARSVVDAAVHIHQRLGPGLFESVYEVELTRELACRGLKTRRQVMFPVQIDNILLKRGFKVDLDVEQLVFVEIKAVPLLAMAHRKQLLTYLKLSGRRLGLLLNFGGTRMKDGIVRLVNGLPE